jgi:hypothetical protein
MRTVDSLQPLSSWSSPWPLPLRPGRGALSATRSSPRSPSRSYSHVLNRGPAAVCRPADRILGG